MKAITKIRFSLITFMSLGLVLGVNAQAWAIGSSQNPQSGALGLEATIPSPPPSQATTIAVPSNSQSFTSIPITVSGLCSNNLLVKVFSNNIFIGSAQCINNSYSLKTDLFNGKNNIYSQDFDSLGQGGPLSGIVSVNYASAQNIPIQSQVTLTSAYGELGANPGQQLVWPVVISGGTPPYAISTDWGDGQPSSLQSSAFAGTISLKHSYNQAGVYTVTVSVSDSQGSEAFLQLVGVANGQLSAASKTQTPSHTGSSAKKGSTSSFGPWWLLLIVLITLLPSFWLGSRHGKSVLLKKYQ